MLSWKSNLCIFNKISGTSPPMGFTEKKCLCLFSTLPVGALHSVFSLWNSLIITVWWKPNTRTFMFQHMEYWLVENGLLGMGLGVRFETRRPEFHSLVRRTVSGGWTDYPTEDHRMHAPLYQTHILSDHWESKSHQTVSKNTKVSICASYCSQPLLETGCLSKPIY